MSDEQAAEAGQEPEVQDAVMEPANQSERASLLDQLAGVRQEIKEQAEPLYLAVPGYKDQLWVRFKPFPVAKTEKKVKGFQKAQQRNRPVLLAGAIDTILDACDEIMLLPERFAGEIGDKGRNLIPIDDLVPVTFEERLATLFKIPGASGMTEGRQVVVAMFPTEQAILRMSVTVNEWLQGELNEEADEEFLGNSGGTTPSSVQPTSAKQG